MRWKTKNCLRYVGMVPIIVLLLATRTMWAGSLPQQAQQALLKGDWAKVLAVLEKTEINEPDVACRLVSAHTCLATNRNNISMLLFLSAKGGKELKLWSEWTASLLKNNPQSPIATYLSADAKARQGKLKEAIDGFTKALDLKKDFALAYNARGVARFLNNEWDEALIDFIYATQYDPKLADAHTNLGTYWVIREVPNGAIEAFNKAIALNPEFAIAYNGIGCAYFGKGEFESAAHCFNIASQLNPILVVAEINQGYASTFTSQFIALANIEKGSGSTFESIMQQHSKTLKEQQIELLKMIPSQKEKEFWMKMDELPWILQSEDETQSLINEYGLQSVQMGAFLKMQELKTNISDTNLKVQNLYSTLDIYNVKIWNIRLAETIASLGFSALGTASDLQKGWEMAQLKTQLTVEKEVLSSITTNKNIKTIIDAVPLSLDPVSLAGSITSSGFKIGQAYLEDKRSSIYVEFETLTTQVPVWGAQLHAIETNLGRFSNISIGQPSSKPSVSSIPGYYTSMERPLTDIGAIASKVDKDINSPPSLPRSALVVAENNFRSNLLQSELSRYGFQTKVISPNIDPQIVAKQYGANVILGIRGSKIKIPKIDLKLPPIPEYRRDDYGPPDDDIPPMRPPAAIGSPRMFRPKIRQDWNWGRPFIPTYPKGPPGGISTKEIAQAYVDKGNWPVLTFFTLAYSPVQANDGEQSEESEGLD